MEASRIWDLLSHCRNIFERGITHEPALLVVSEATGRKLIFLVNSLKGGPAAGNALLYRHQAFPQDHRFSVPRSP